MKSFAARRAQSFLECGLAAVNRGEFADALAEFRASADLYPTAEALTYWGWMEHRLGDSKRAIELCEQAIEVDPSFGNPYNDIGSYLFSEGKLDEAIPWFEKATKAERYEPRQFPHMNLGRIYLSRHQYQSALAEFEKAQGHAPDDPSIQKVIEQIRARKTVIN